MDRGCLPLAPAPWQCERPNRPSMQARLHLQRQRPGPDLQDVEILTFHSWDASWHRVASVTASNSTVMFTSNTSTYCVGSQAPEGGRRYIVENVREGLDEPGEWYYDRTSGLLSYYPLADESAGTVTAWVPMVTTLLQVTGAQHVRLEGVLWQHGATFFNRFRPYASVGLLSLSECQHATVHNCVIQHTGVAGLTIGTNSSEVEVSNTVVQDTGGDGIGTSSTSSNIHLHHNLVNSTGHITLWQPAGAWTFGLVRILPTTPNACLHAGIRARGHSVLVEYNDVGFCPYGGILVGWQLGTATPARGQPVDPSLVVQYNRVHDFGLGILSDFGGIYLSSADNTCFNASTCYLPTLIFNNIVMHGRHYDYGSQGIYMDEQVGRKWEGTEEWEVLLLQHVGKQVSGQNISHNMIYDIGDAGVFWHCGRNHYTTNNMLLLTGRQSPSAIRR